MLQINNKFFSGLMLVVLFCLMQTTAEAVQRFTVTQTNPTPANAIFTMGNTESLIFQINNTSTTVGDGRIFEVRFELAAGIATTFSSATTAPAGWTRTAYSATLVTFRANSWDNAIATAGNGPTTSKDFTLLLLGSWSADVSNIMRRATVNYTTTTTGPPFTSTGSKFENNFGGWSWRSLSIDSFTAVDSVTGFESTAPGRQIRVRLTVTNRSTSNLTGIVSNPQPPQVFVTWTTGSTTITTTSNPSLNLNAGQTGTLEWIYTIGSNCTVATPPAGSVYFSVTNVRNSTNVATSKSAISNTVAIGCFSGSLSLSSTCISSNTNVTVTMSLVNRYAQSITGLSATLTPGGTATKTLVSGPSYSSTTLAASGGTATVTWVYNITGSASQTYSFTGTASGTLQTSPTKPVAATITPSPTGAIVAPPKITITPASVTVDKNRMVTVDFSFTNSLCNPVNKVNITIPTGWTLYADPNDGSRGSAIVNIGAGSEATDWTESLSGNTITFTAGTTLALSNSGSFTLFFEQIPTSQGTYTFSITITDTLGGTAADNKTIIIGAAGSGITTPGLWRESY